jgi:phospholipid-binding lipoprotein MlaA
MKKNRSLNQGLSSFLAGAVLAAVATGCATPQAARHNDLRDPWEGWNRGTQSFNDGLDDYLMKPLAQGYQYIAPSFVDRGVTNFFSNVDDIGVTINDFLQLKYKQGGMDASRFLVNTTVGVAGFIDVASKLNLPKHNEDFDQTLGTWGVPSGPYLVLPLFGPSTPRGVGGLVGDTATNPLSYLGAGVGAGTYGLRMTDFRADNLSATKIADEASVDRYEFIRNAYFQQRNYLLHDGNPPEEDDLDFEDEAAGNAPKGKVNVYLDDKPQ